MSSVAQERRSMMLFDDDTTKSKEVPMVSKTDQGSYHTAQITKYNTQENSGKTIQNLKFVSLKETDLQIINFWQGSKYIFVFRGRLHRWLWKAPKNGDTEAFNQLWGPATISKDSDDR